MPFTCSQLRNTTSPRPADPWVDSQSGREAVETTRHLIFPFPYLGSYHFRSLWVNRSPGSTLVHLVSPLTKKQKHCVNKC